MDYTEQCVALVIKDCMMFTVIDEYQNLNDHIENMFKKRVRDVVL
jgi:hypothetical protein